MRGVASKTAPARRNLAENRGDKKRREDEHARQPDAVDELKLVEAPPNRASRRVSTRHAWVRAPQLQRGIAIPILPKENGS